MSTALQALSLAGGRGRAACAKVAEFTSELTTALRRAVPFIARRRVAVTADMPRCISFADLAMDVTIVHAEAFVANPSGVRGLVLVDEAALARILDGVLGGDGSPSGGLASLTSAQKALASRVSATMLRAFGDVIGARLGITIERTPVKDIEAGSAVVATLAIDGGGRILVAIPLSLIRTDEPVAKDAIDTGIAAAMTDVELDVVAELGKVRLSLESLAGLKVGDVLRLSLPLDERARVCAGGAVLFQGRPTASGEAVAVALEAQVG
jgi:flagellar motor switch protein FliM